MIQVKRLLGNKKVPTPVMGRLKYMDIWNAGWKAPTCVKASQGRGARTHRVRHDLEVDAPGACCRGQGAGIEDQLNNPWLEKSL